VRSELKEAFPRAKLLEVNFGQALPAESDVIPIMPVDPHIIVSIYGLSDRSKRNLVETSANRNLDHHVEYLFASTDLNAAQYINHAYVVLTNGNENHGQIEIEWTNFYTEFKLDIDEDAAHLKGLEILVHDNAECKGAISEFEIEPLF
jgi:hypothetical protein